jgi:hypothetical protein
MRLQTGKDYQRWVWSYTATLIFIFVINMIYLLFGYMYIEAFGSEYELLKVIYITTIVAAFVGPVVFRITIFVLENICERK